MKSFIPALLFCTFVFNGSAQWTATNGPYGGTINCIINNNSVLYAGTDDRVYSSSDSGVTWIQFATQGLTFSSVKSLTVNNNILYACVWNGGVFSIPLSGSTWTTLNNGLTNLSVQAIISDGNELFCGTSGGGVFRSTDNGLNWSQVNTGLSSLTVNSLIKSGSSLFAGTTSGVFKSDNNGVSWSASLSGTQVFSLTTDGSIIFAGTNGIVHRSVNNGASWVPYDILSGTIRGLLINGNDLYAGTSSSSSNGMYKSTVNGSSWTPINNGISTQSILSLAAIGSELFAGTNATGVYYSSNAGSSWSESSNGIRNLWIKKILYFNNNIYVATRFGGIHRSTDNGNSWSTINDGLPLILNTTINSLSGYGSRLYAGTGGKGIYSSHYLSTTWTILNSNTQTWNVRCVLNNGNSIFAGLSSGVVYRSDDNGNNWSSINNGLNGNTVNCFLFNNPNLLAGTGNGVYISPDNGNTWTQITNGIPSVNIVSFISCSGNIYAGTSGGGSNGGIYKSTNGGFSWTHSYPGTSTQVIPDLDCTGSEVYAATFSGVLYSDDNGGNWQLQTLNSSSNNVESIAICGGTVFAGTYQDGAYKNSGACQPTTSNIVIDACEPYVSPSGSYTWDSTGIYTDTILNVAGCDSLITINLTIDPVPSGFVSAQGTTEFCAGGSVLLNAPSGTGYNYIWKKYGNIITGADSSSLYVTSTGKYKCIITNSLGCSKTSNTVVVTVNPLPVSSIISNGPTTFCRGESVMLSSTTNTGVTYQWKKYGNLISGAISQDYSVSSSGKYKCIVTDHNGCSRSSNPIVVNVNPLPSAIISANGPTDFCAGDSVLLTANSGNGYTYQWKKYGNFISGATSQDFTASNSGKYKCIVTNNLGCSRSSNSISVNIICRVQSETIISHNIEVYPNPSSGDVYIHSGNLDLEKVNITVTTVDGKVFSGYEIESTEAVYSIKNLPSGVYFIRISDDVTAEFFKIIILNN